MAVAEKYLLAALRMCVSVLQCDCTYWPFFYPQVITDIYSLLLHFITEQKA